MLLFYNKPRLERYSIIRIYYSAQLWEDIVGEGIMTIVYFQLYRIFYIPSTGQRIRLIILRIESAIILSALLS